MSSARANRTLWIAWLLATAGLVAWLAYVMLGDAMAKTLFMPGELTGGHHQLQPGCTACHTDPLGGGEVLQDACISCHGEDRKKPQDSHPRTKFLDPRNADRLEHIDALRDLPYRASSGHHPEKRRHTAG